MLTFAVDFNTLGHSGASKKRSTRRAKAHENKNPILYFCRPDAKASAEEVYSGSVTKEDRAQAGATRNHWLGAGFHSDIEKVVFASPKVAANINL